MKKVRFKLAELPGLPTEVGIARSVRRQEVGGAICLTVAAGLAVYAVL